MQKNGNPELPCIVRSGLKPLGVKIVNQTSMKSALQVRVLPRQLANKIMDAKTKAFTEGLETLAKQCGITDLALFCHTPAGHIISYTSEAVLRDAYNHFGPKIQRKPCASPNPSAR